MLSNAKVTEISKPSPNLFYSHKTHAMSPCPESHLKEESFLSLQKPEETQLKMQIHFSFSATSV